MRITINPVLNMETLLWVSNDGVYDYDGPIVLCKGDPTAQAEEQQTMQFDQQLMQIFQSQYSTQQSQLKYLQNQMQPMINNPTGYSAAQLAALRTGATDTNAQQYQNAQAALNNQTSQASGGSKLTGVSGAVTEADAALLNAKAQTDAASQEQITEANANLQQQNYWNAINALNGVAVEENPQSYASESNQSGGTVAGLSQAVTAANQSQLLGALGGMASGMGSALGGYLSKGCWVAASFWGWNSIKTWVVRFWVLTEAPAWFRNFYLANGEQLAKTPARWAFRPIFEVVLATR
jgi:hypothetical protein